MAEPRDTLEIPAVTTTPAASPRPPRRRARRARARRGAAPVAATPAEAEPASADTEPGSPDVPAPPEPQRVADTGLTEAFLCDLALKHVYQGGSKEAIELAADLCLGYPIVADLLEWLKGQELVTTRGGSGAFGGAKLRYGVTERGLRAAVEALNRDGYLGPAPVPFAQYRSQTEAQSLTGMKIASAR